MPGRPSTVRLHHPPAPQDQSTAGPSPSGGGWATAAPTRPGRAGGRVFQGGCPAPALLVSPPGPAGSSPPLSWPRRSGYADGALSAETAGTGAGRARCQEAGPGTLPRAGGLSRGPSPPPPHPSWDQDPERGRLGRGTHRPPPGQQPPRPLGKGARGPGGWHHPARSMQSQAPGPDQFQGFRHSGAPAGLSRRSVPGTS